ncbi:polyphosphate kinase 2 family protein [Aequorivita sp. H23M31]|uniref:Polyphosphate kinase 2 family protein n=1 Tax=Aequorivita ciconiae TaxID=2494375 RepID=A0A410G115_9FLAO|nr:PPK2 family polyphosphate kinase [Aequorivita sp. H23M31]QAA80963.1 polyphosphate kinase 2 family protein [Aequorivita sp. H23M31]
MKDINIEDFKVTEKIKIGDTNTRWDLNASKKKLKKKLKDTRNDLGELQDTLYAHGKYAVLVCLQGMDTAGKDSLIREVFKDFNARGVVVHSFKTPTVLEKRHDYLWRHYIALPERGKFGVFNRTHYENVLVTRVHPDYILGENLPHINNLEDIDNAFWERRFQQINDFERIIQQNGTIIFKFFLNISKDEQKDRQLRRLDKPNKNWKFSPGDLDERDLWDKYQYCYEDAINHTSKPHAPWYIIPSDDKNTARVITAEIMLQELKKYKDIKEPELDDDIKAKISEYRERLKND